MNANKKTVDKTYLSIDTAEDRGFIHRDYIAHCLRWTHVLKRLYERKTYESARILDIGCGRELPFAKTLYSSKLSPRMYFGVDVGPINDEDVAKIAKTQKFTHKLWENTNFLELTDEDVDTQPLICHCGDFIPGNHEGHTPTPMKGEPDLPNIVTCFECLEHVEPEMMMKMLEHMKLLTSPDVRFFISTPNWNRTDCAANHVNEMLYEALGAAFERHGFVVENVYGTFASIRDYEHLLDRGAGLDCQVGNGSLGGKHIGDIFDMLREYYDTNFLSCVFAPLFPAQSRNCLWELRKRPNDDKNNKFKVITEIQTPWSSSEKWSDMAL